MAEKSKNYGNITITSKYTARTAPSGAQAISTAPDYVPSAAYSCTFTDLGIPAGSTVTSAIITFTAGNPLHGDGGKKLTISGTTYTTVTSGMAVAYNQGSFTLQFKSGTYNTSYPAPGLDTYTYLENSSGYTFGDFKLTVTYTEPYSKCTPPTSVSVSPASTGKSKPASLTWSGAGGGTNNAVNGYDIHSSTTSATTGFAFLKSSATSPAEVTSSATNGGKIYYKVLAKGAAGASYYSDLSSVSATLETTWTDASAPNSVTGPNNVIPGTTQRISWSGAGGGVNNPISKYQLFYSGDNFAAYLAETTSLYADTTAHATSGSAYTYKVKVIAEQNSILSTASHTMTSLVGAITPPSSVSLDANNLAPGGQTTLRWSGQSNGTNNAILSYDVQTSTDNATWSLLGNTTASAYSPVTAGTTNNATVYFRILVKGERINAYSGSVGLVTKVTKPNPPSIVSLNDDNLPVGWSTPKTLSWSGASSGSYNNNIYGYRVMVSTNDGALTQYGSDIVSGLTSGSTTVTSLTSNGTQKFYVHTIGATSVTAEKLSASSSAPATLTTTVTNPTAPTASIPTNVAPGSQQSLSWSGAVHGTNNNITTYQIYEKVGSGSWVSVGPDGTSPFTVSANTTNGGTKSYYIVADAPHGDSPASNTVVMTTTVSKPFAPTAVSLSATSNLAPDADVTLSWSGAKNAAYNNPIVGYRIMRSVDGAAYAQVGADLSLATSTQVVKTKNGNGTHAFRVIALGTTQEGVTVHSDMSEIIATATTVVSTPTAPAVVEVVNGGGVAPGATRTLKWSEAAAGTYNNPIKGYQVYRSSAKDSGYAAFGNVILTTNTYHSGIDVTAPTSDGSAFYYKVVTLGNTLSVNSAMSSSYGTLTTQKLPSAGVLNKASVTATGSETITVTITPQLSTYTHQVTWYINGTYTSGPITKNAGVNTDTYTIPQSWILATTTTTTSVAAKCKVETFDGAVSIGVNEYSFTVNVPGASAFTLSGVPLTATGSASATATIASKYSGYKHTVEWSTAGYAQTHNVAAGTSTQAYAIPIAWCNSVPNADTFIVTVKVTTIKVAGGGDMILGSASSTFTASVPTTIVPTISSFTPTGVDLSWSLYVRTKSRVKWTPVAAGAYSSTIVSYKIDNANLNSGTLAYSAGTSWTSGTLDYSGVQTFTLTVTDSRGRTATTSNTVTVTNYNAPSIASAAFNRADIAGVIKLTSGTYINLAAAFAFSDIGSNAITAKAYYKATGTTTWLPAGGQAVTIAGTGPNRSGTVTAYGGGTIDITKLYDVKVTVTDAYGTTELATLIPTVSRVFDLKNSMAAFGGIATIPNALQVPVGWGIYSNGNKEVFHTGQVIPLANGGTGATTAAAALTALGLTATAAELNFVDGVTSAIQTQINGKAATSHTHVKANITDFPASMPASDVSAWAKAATKPSYTNTEVGAAATSHAHGNITSGGLIGTTASIPVITGTGGLLQAGSFGTAAGTFCQGNDARLSDARTPSAHSHAISDLPTITVAKGGTGATDAATARTNLGITLSNLGALGTTAKAADSSLLNGAADATAATASTIMKRDPSGYVFAVIYNDSWSQENTAAGSYIYKNASDGYHRSKSLANVRTEIVTKAAVEAVLTGAITTHTHAYAATSHGNHVPTVGTANNAIFLRNDNTWQTVTAANIGAAASSHTHSYAPLTGAGTSGSWGISVTGSSASCTGNAATATSAGKLTTTRALTIGATAKNFDGSAAVSWTLAEIGAQKTITANTTEPTGGTAGDMYIKY